MAAPKLRLVFYEDNNDLSYFYLEKSEGLRVIAILKLLPKLKGKEWTPLSAVAKAIKANVLTTEWTILKMAGAQRIDVKVDGRREILVEQPFILLKKEQHNTRNNYTRYKYLRATIYIKPHS